tara:strand:+ start:300 stop:1040 length:741 start_codon:yes stop_codon:yes gene_type:complete
VRARSLSFLLNSKNKILKKIYFFYNIYFRNYKYLKSSSQFDEDKFLKNFFKNKPIGKYLDLGCFHPVRDNNTYQLYRKGWRGINVDMNSLSIDLFNYFRPKDINLNIGIAKKKGKKTLYFSGDFSPLNTIDENHLDFLNKNFNLKEKKIKLRKIQTQNINNVLKKYKLNKIDFLTIDLEGYEYEILNILNFNKYKINLICIEILSHNLKSKKNRDKILQILKKNNFKLVYKTGVNCFYKNTKWNYQ